MNKLFILVQLLFSLAFSGCFTAEQASQFEIKTKTPSKNQPAYFIDIGNLKNIEINKDDAYYYLELDAKNKILHIKIKFIRQICPSNCYYKDTNLSIYSKRIFNIDSSIKNAYFLITKSEIKIDNLKNKDNIIDISYEISLTAESKNYLEKITDHIISLPFYEIFAKTHSTKNYFLFDLPKGWKIFPNYPIDERGFSVIHSDIFFQQRFIATDENTIKEAPLNDLNMVHMLYNKKDINPNFDLKSATQIFTKNLTQANQFWQDFNGYKPYIMFIISQNEKVGSKLGQGSQHISAVTDIPEEFATNSMHELFHHWFGSTGISSKNNEFLWLIEGFTTFYELRLSLRAQTIDIDKFLEVTNRYLSDYKQDPNNDISNNILSQKLNNNEPIGRTAYNRGFIAATNWNFKIRQNFNEQQSLDQMVHEIRYLIHNNQFDEAKLIKIGTSLVGSSFYNEYQDWIINGSNLQPYPQVLGDCFTFNNGDFLVNYIKWTQHPLKCKTWFASTL